MMHVDYLDRAVGVDPHLFAVVLAGAMEYAISTENRVRILSGKRTKSMQRKLVDMGKSPTMDSRHLTGDAIDLAILKDNAPVAVWEFEEYSKLNDFIQVAALASGHPVEWGGDWKSRDGVHFQNPR